MRNRFWNAPLNLGLMMLMSAGWVVGLEPFTRSAQFVLAQEANEATTDEQKKAEADRLLQQGNDQFNRSQFRDAIASWEAALNLYRTIEDVKWEARALNNLGSAYYSLSRYREAIALCEQSLAISRAIEDIQGEAMSLNNLGGIYYSLGEYREAIAYHEQSLVISRAIEDVQGESASLNNLGLAYASLGEYREAIVHYEQSLAISQAIEDVQGEAMLLNNLGLAYYSLSGYREAIALYEQSLAISQAIEDVQGEANSLDNLGLAYASLGEYREAIAYHEQSLAIFRAIEDVRGESASLNNLGEAYRTLNEYREAIAYYEQSLAIFRAIEDVQGESASLNNLGLAYASLGEYREAIAYYEQSLAIFRAIEDVQGEANSLNNLGSAYDSLGEYREAIAYYEQSLAINRAIEDLQGEARSLNNLGNTYASLGEYQEAIDFYEQALAISQQIEAVETEGVVLSNLGIAYQAQGQDDLAITFFKDSVNVREGIRTNIRDLSPDLQQSYTETISETYRRLADLLIQQGRISEALQVLELLKAAEIQEYTRGEIISPGSRDVDLFPEEAEIIDTHGSLIALGRTIADCEASGGCADLNDYYAQRTALTAKYNEIIGALSTDLDDRPRDPTPDPTALLGENVKRIVESQPNTVLIYPVVLENEIWILWASAGGIADPIKVPVSESDVNQAVFKFQELMRNCELPGCSEADIPAIQAVAQELYSWLMPSQLEDELRANGIENLVFALDRTVRYIPMSALFDGEQYLIENYTVSTVTAAWLTPESPLTGSEISVMALGLSEAVPANPAEDLPGFNPLANVPLELSAIVHSPESRSTEGIYPGISYLNDRFDETSFYQIQGHQILHIATHGLFVPTALDSSFLVLRNKEVWRISQINNLKQFFTDLRLVVLSACETALGGRELNADGETDLDGREISGIAQSFMDAGADTVVASLWQVSDRSTSILMQGFYEGLTQDENPLTIAQAMRQIQLTMLYQGEVDVTSGNRSSIVIERDPDASIAEQLRPNYAHPYYWAPFIVIGNGLESLSE